jgi:carotenoid 1,2-hydratase
VFSPYYAWARRRDARALPERHCALNLALYGAGPRRWAMTERGAAQRSAASLGIGPSSLHWDGQTLEVDIDEWALPWPRRLRGTLRVRPQVRCAFEQRLDGAAGRHRWRPWAPRAHIEVVLREPALRWQGTAYCDANDGDEPLECGFRHWHWARAHLPREATAIVYDTEPRQGEAATLALWIDRSGRCEQRDARALQAAALPASRWGLARRLPCDAGRATLLATLEDGPFYARSWVDAMFWGQRARAFHESLALTRFEQRWVQALLPFRMPRHG